MGHLVHVPHGGNAAVSSPSSLHDLAERFVALKAAEAAAEAAAKAAGAQLLARMSAESITGLKVGDAAVSLIAGSTRQSLDGAAAEAKIHYLVGLIDELARRLAAHGDDVVLPDDLDTIPLKIAETKASVRCKVTL